MPNYDDPKIEERWCQERRAEVTSYLKDERVDHGSIGKWPAWHVAPFVSVWAIESKSSPGHVGWWVLAGDMPTDYVSAENVNHPREAVRIIGQRWLKFVEQTAKGVQRPDYRIGPPEKSSEIAMLLMPRAKVLTEWADDDTLWEDL